jgi:hypothetical protein
VSFMNDSRKKILQFPKSPEELADSPIVCQIGSERFAIHYQIEDLPPASPPPRLLILKPRAKKPAK